MRSQDYRPDIDGLRAVAVLLVVLNHADIAPFDGGFLGVDVFFVISGYLITRIVAREVDDGQFSYRSFIERRARRILPALFVVLVPVTLLATTLLQEPDRGAYFASLISVATFWSNIRFFVDVGYFDVNAVYKPLLHTWSLAVEEQFYLFFPPLLLLLKNRQHRFNVLLFAAAVSAGTMAYVSSSAAFYLLTSRAWELIAGSLAALYALQFQSSAVNSGSKVSIWMSEASNASLLILLASALIFDESTLWPSHFTLIPVVATVVILLGASPTRNRSAAQRILSSKPLVIIGLSSYSIYLVHYPIFAFVRYRTIGDLTLDVRFALVGLSIICGLISWQLVEIPTRDVRKVSNRTIREIALLGITLLVCIGLVGSPKVANSTSAGIGTTIPATARVMLIGDSHAERLIVGLRQQLGAELAVFNSDGCVPFFGVDRFDYRFKKGSCATFARASLEATLRNNDIDVVVLASMGPVYLSGRAFHGMDQARVTEDGLVLVDQPEIIDRWTVFEVGLRDTLKRIEMSGKVAVVVVDVPELGIEPQHCNPERPISCRNPRNEVDQRTARYKALISRVVGEFKTSHVFDPTGLFCDVDFCSGVYDNKRQYRDVDHLSDDGSIRVGNVLGPLIRNLLANS